jgi:replicative DNA helicase
MFIYRPEVEVVTPMIPVKVLVAKHRNGATGDVDLMFQGNRVRFMNVEKQHQESNGLPVLP